MYNKKIVLSFIIVLFLARLAFTQAEQATKMPDEAPEEGLLQKEKDLLIEEFLFLATTSDTVFDEILIDELTLKYQKDLRLPARDLVVSVVQQYEMYLSEDRESPDTTVSLSKLFPLTGTEVEVDYSVSSGFNSTTRSSDLTFSIAQPIAQNAFGRSTRVLSKIVGLEVDVARHQITEAYEDYLAQILTAYLDWYEAYENLKIGQSSYDQNLKLLENIEERRKNKIALPIDVNKVTLQVLAKKETLIDLKESYQNAYNVIKSIIRQREDTQWIPGKTSLYTTLNLDYENEYEKFRNYSRTYQILGLLENRSSLQVERDADDLLPSISLTAGYRVDGEEYALKEENNLVFAGLELEWPIGHQVERAEYEVSKIFRDKQRLTNANTHYRLYRDISNLLLQIQREEQLGEIAKEKIVLARSILTDETENYSFGKVTLNDYISAVNVLDNNRFDEVRHDVLHSKLIIEWLRITDQLISKKEIDQKNKRFNR